MLIFSGFAFDSFGEWKSWLGHLFGHGNTHFISGTVKKLLVNNCWLLGISVVSITPIVEILKDRIGSAGSGSYTRARTAETVWATLLLILSFVVLAGNMTVTA